MSNHLLQTIKLMEATLANHARLIFYCLHLLCVMTWLLFDQVFLLIYCDQMTDLTITNLASRDSCTVHFLKMPHAKTG